MGPDRISKVGLSRMSWVLLLISAWLVMGEPAAAQTGRIFVVVLAPDRSYQNRPVTVSAIADGRIIFQQDASLESPPNKKSVLLGNIPLGEIDVRVECEGMMTEVKRGVQVFEQDRNVEIALRPGEGVHIVELAVGGLAREEVAARLRALESSTAALKEQLEKLSKPER